MVPKNKYQDSHNNGERARVQASHELLWSLVLSVQAGVAHGWGSIGPLKHRASAAQGWRLTMRRGMAMKRVIMLL